MESYHARLSAMCLVQLSSMCFWETTIAVEYNNDGQLAALSNLNNYDAVCVICHCDRCPRAARGHSRLFGVFAAKMREDHTKMREDQRILAKKLLDEEDGEWRDDMGAVMEKML